jgi:glycine cleavage system aminomethyltransferase T
VGLVFDGEVPAPFVTVRGGTSDIGVTLSSVYSPALRRAAALAQIDEDKAHPGAAVSLSLPGSPDRAAARIVDLPFLPAPDPIDI